MSTQISSPGATVSSSLSTVSPQNAEVAKLIQPAYTLAELEAVRKVLASHKTLTLRRYPNGGQSAVTILDIYETLFSAMDGLLMNMWDRDNVMQCLAELKLADDAELRAGIESVDANSWRRGMNAALDHHKKGDFRFVDICLGRASNEPKDYMRRPHIRYPATNPGECGDNWGHGQNDSLSFLLFMLYHGLNTGRLDWSDIDLQPNALSFVTLLHGFFWKIRVWEDMDLGAWEDKVAQHWSSVACVLAALREQHIWFKKTGEKLHYNKDGHDFWVTESGVQELITKCEDKLREIGLNEYVISQDNSTRNVDLAMINPMLLAAFSGKALVDDAYTVTMLEKIEAELLGHLGARRYAKDLWDGRVNRYDLAAGEEAQWVHGSPQMSFIYGDLYQRTGDEKYLDKQVQHFNRALASIAPSWLTPEAWIVDMRTRRWVPDANEPLAWATAMLVLSFAGMKTSLTKKASVAAAAPSAPAVEVASAAPADTAK
ncbi:MAG: hypothetical protein KGS72_25065 [Cyanobacteria bacterium REEB67]|nr:hypothetical protein [Cyanobacteria bacterium REEB67]